MKSTSFHKITADRGTFFYKILVRILYFPLNAINNLFPFSNVDPNLRVSFFKPHNCQDLETQDKHLDIKASPARKFSDLFWMNYNRLELEKEIGKINVCDIGCGTGKYFSMINKFSGNRIENYFGIVIKANKNWEKIKTTANNVNFTTYDGRHIIDLIPSSVNLIISQSAIEHFIEDITIFKQIKQFIVNSKHPVFQIHLFLSAACLLLYRFHGVRQYTPRTISKITRIFGNGFTKELKGLGGVDSNKIHKKYIKYGISGKDFRETKTEEYNIECYNSMLKDLTNPLKTNPTFYVLLIKVKK